MILRGLEVFEKKMKKLFDLERGSLKILAMEVAVAGKVRRNLIKFAVATSLKVVKPVKAKSGSEREHVG